ncbi:MAG: hypothetical protein M0Z48_00410 [Nitrospiraceae bacterium]|nr:hypothetical protein [Nitrospiraceae bacterium]
MKKWIFVLAFIVVGCTNQGGSAPSSNTESPAAPPVLSESDYKATATPVTYTDNEKGIYYKDYVKNPAEYKGRKMKIRGTIFTIEEQNGQTALQMWIDNDMDQVIVYYPGTLKIYKNDIIEIWGEGGDNFEGENAFGAKLDVPTLKAAYIKKVGTAQY